MSKTLICCLVVALLVSCSPDKKADSPSQPVAKPVAKEAQFETGRAAFQKMLPGARLWAPDARPFRLQSQFTPDAPTAEGKAGLWRTSVASPSKRMMKSFAWSGLVGPDAPEPGVSFSAEDSWSPSNSSTVPFELAFLKVDSDKAYEVAQKNGGDKLTRKDPHQPVIFLLAWDAGKSQLVWHVLYGENPTETKLRIAVDATSGDFLRIEK